MGLKSYNFINQVHEGVFEEEFMYVRQIERRTTNKPFNIYTNHKIINHLYSIKSCLLYKNTLGTFIIITI